MYIYMYTLYRALLPVQNSRMHISQTNKEVYQYFRAGQACDLRTRQGLSTGASFTEACSPPPPVGSPTPTKGACPRTTGA